MKPFFHFVTLFPQVVSPWLSTSILGRAVKAGVFDFELIQLRDFSRDKHASVDDVAYGGGGGMVLKIEPLVAATEALWGKYGRENCHTVYFSPAGKKLDQGLLDSYLQDAPPHLIFICGHYEGIDQRFVDGWVDAEISLGDFVLTGGELPALAFADALVRLCDGALGDEAANQNESFRIRLNDQKRLLEYPHYTRPPKFRDLEVPSVLLSGDHGRIETWRSELALKRTQAKRPDLIKSNRTQPPPPEAQA